MAIHRSDDSTESAGPHAKSPIARVAFLSFLLGGVATAQTSAQLSADTHFPVSGGELTVTLKGKAGSTWFLKGASAPRELDSRWGKVFLEPSTMVDLASGTMPLAGFATVTIDVPSDPALHGRLFYLQAGTMIPQRKQLSNAIVVRIEATTPAGARQPAGIAVAPDGSRAWVVNEEDASVSVLDPTTDTVIGDFPIGQRPTTFDQTLKVAIDPEGRHLFVVNPATEQVTMIHVASDSIAAQIPAPFGCRAIAFKFDAVSRRVFVASPRDQAVLVFTEAPEGTFALTGELPLKGREPAVLALLPNGHLMVGQHTSLELEVIDPDDGDGDPLVTRVALGSRPLAIALHGGRAFVPTFTPSGIFGIDGDNEVLEYDTTTFALLGSHWKNLGTDYYAAAVSSQHLVIAGTGSGSLLVADPVALTATAVNLVPGEIVPGIPFDVALVTPPGGGEPDRAWVIDHFRETVRPVVISSGPPFTLLAEIPLAHSGAPRLPLTHLSQIERGELLYSSVFFFNGSPAVPNPVTCNTCHPNLFSDSITHSRGKQCQPLFAIGKLAPFAWAGDVADLTTFSQAAFTTHGKIGGKVNPGALADLTAFQAGVTKSPANPFRTPNGSLSPAAQRGEILFGNGVTLCSTCHAAPDYIPLPPNPPTIVNGVGTGMAPINVATLLGLWSSAPYLHDGTAATLLDVLNNNPGDLHGVTSGLSTQDKIDLVAFLKSL